MRYAIELSQNKTANGGDEWSLRVEAGKRPEEMLPEVLAHAAGMRA